MIVIIRKLFKYFSLKTFLSGASISYSQFGEDLIVKDFFNKMDKPRITYLDVGANEARYISNTYYFYEKGSKGVLIEPNPVLAKKLVLKRPKDKVLSVGIGEKNAEPIDFYVFPKQYNGLSTFSKEEALHWQNVGMKGKGKMQFEKIIKIPLVTINDIIKDHFQNIAPNFISIDVEGLDLQIVQSFNFEIYRPEIFCIETLNYTDQQQTYKNEELINFMISKGYKVYADTRINTIFARADLFQ